MIRPSRPWFAVALLVASCSSTSGTVATVQTTLITADPSTFVGTLTCAQLPGAWQSYVATLTDVTDSARPIQLPSSPPVPCSMPVSFASVVPGHFYTGRIDAYDRTNVVPYGNASDGSPRMVDPATGQDVPPRWAAQCGEAPTTAPVETDAGTTDTDAADLWSSQTTACDLTTNVRLQHCEPLEALQAPGESSITVHTAQLNGSLPCGTAPGQIARFRIVPEAPDLPERTVNCGADVQFLGVTPGATYQFRAEAIEQGSTSVSWVSACRGKAQAGIDIPANCDPLTNRGALALEIDTLLTLAQHACSASDVTNYRAVLLGSANPASARACTLDTTYSSLPAATYQLVVDGYDASGASVFSAFCQGTVAPARTTIAECVVGPNGN